MNLVERLRAMVAVDSVSGRSNRPMIEVLVAQVDGLGGDVRYHTYNDENGIEKTNLLVQFGPSGRPALALVGHSDTVPYDPQWAEALTLTEQGGRLYGRGSADTKAGLAAMIEALSTFDRSRLQRPVMLIATADEEIGCRGARRMVADGVVHPQHAIIAEPTMLIPIRGHKGYCADELEVQGREAHSAYPHLGRSAITDAGRLLGALEDIARQVQEQRDESFDPPFTTLNVGTIEGGKARNVIAGQCRFPLEWRPIPAQSLEFVHDLVLARIEQLGLSVQVLSARRDAGVLTAADAAIVRCLEQVSGRKAETVAFGTELPYLTALGAQACVIGPGDIREAHRTGEFVPHVELEAAVDVYRQAIEQFCATP